MSIKFFWSRSYGLFWKFIVSFWINPTWNYCIIRPFGHGFSKTCFWKKWVFDYPKIDCSMASNFCIFSIIQNFKKLAGSFGKVGEWLGWLERSNYIHLTFCWFLFRKKKLLLTFCWLLKKCSPKNRFLNTRARF